MESFFFFLNKGDQRMLLQEGANRVTILLLFLFLKTFLLIFRKRENERN